MHLVGKGLRRIISNISATSLFISQHIEDKGYITPVSSAHLSIIGVTFPFEGIGPSISTALSTRFQKTVGRNTEDDVTLQGRIDLTISLATPIFPVGFSERLEVIS